MKPPRYTVLHEAVVARFPWIVTDAAGNPALWHVDPKVGRVPLRFKTEGCAHAAVGRVIDREHAALGRAVAGWHSRGDLRQAQQQEGQVNALVLDAG
jgi:hypothetical protein